MSFLLKIKLLKEVKSDADISIFISNNLKIENGFVSGRELLFKLFNYNKKSILSAIKRLILSCNAQSSDYLFERNISGNDYLLAIEFAIRCIRHLIKKNKVYGIGINDHDGKITLGCKKIPSYVRWASILERCYDKSSLKKKPYYKGCTVSDEWLLFSNFKKWHDKNHIEGYQLDKDIIFKGNKIYSEKTCAFVPKRINMILLTCKKSRGKFPLGVHRKKSGNYNSGFKKETSKFNVGTFKTPELAHEAYKIEKEKYIKEVAKEYFEKGLIGLEIYNVLIAYEVEIND